MPPDRGRFSQAANQCFRELPRAVLVRSDSGNDRQQAEGQPPAKRRSIINHRMPHHLPDYPMPLHTHTQPPVQRSTAESIHNPQGGKQDHGIANSPQLLPSSTGSWVFTEQEQDRLLRRVLATALRRRVVKQNGKQFPFCTRVDKADWQKKKQKTKTKRTVLEPDTTTTCHYCSRNTSKHRL